MTTLVLPDTAKIIYSINLINSNEVSSSVRAELRAEIKVNEQELRAIKTSSEIREMVNHTRLLALIRAINQSIDFSNGKET